MMTLDEAIEHAEHKVIELKNQAEAYGMLDNFESSVEHCRICAEEHRQLAEWLKDYKRLLEKENEI